jgi:Fe-S-cluster containining protein
MQLNKQKYPKVECSRCGRCCRVPLVPITHKDLRRLVRSTGLPVSRIVRFCPLSEMEFDPESGVWITFKSGRRAAMVLRKRSGRCVFQTGECACLVYKARPQTCRTFPYSVEFQDVGRNVVNKISLNEVLKCNAVKCRRIDVDNLLANVRKEIREDKEYHKLIRKWNESANKGGTAEFLQFIGF